MSVIDQKARLAALALAPEGSTRLDPATILLLANLIIAVLKIYAACRDFYQVGNPSLWNRVRLRWLVWGECRRAGVRDWFAVYEALLGLGRTATPADMELGLMEVRHRETPAD